MLLVFAVTLFYAWFTMPGEDVPGDSGLFGGSNIDPSLSCSIMFH
jgi:hypothetical protein